MVALLQLKFKFVLIYMLVHNYFEQDWLYVTALASTEKTLLRKNSKILIKIKKKFIKNYMNEMNK